MNAIIMRFTEKTEKLNVAYVAIIITTYYTRLKLNPLDTVVDADADADIDADAVADFLLH